MNLTKLFERVRTKEGADRLLAEIDLLLASVYSAGVDSLANILKSRVRSWVSEILRQELFFQDVNAEAELKNIKKEIEKLSVIKLSLAFEPTDLAIERMSFFVKKNFGEKTILDIYYDPSILAGTIIIFKGMYRDYSLKKIFDSEFPKLRLHLFKLIAH